MRCPLFCLLLCFSLIVSAKQNETFNPIYYGLLDAKTGIERFDALLRCHQDAVKYGGRVSYEGIKSIEIEIPFKAQSIPLPEETDFANVKIYAFNHDRNYILFLMENEVQEVEISGESIDKENFKSHPILGKGNKLLVIEDQNLWIKERIGYQSSGYKRQDIQIIKNGVAINKTIQPYNNNNSLPKGWCCSITKRKKIVKNLDFYRTENCTRKTYPVGISCQYNVELSNITMTTPQNTDIVDDCGIIVTNCAKVVMNDITINGTYSQDNKAGSGVRLINVYDVRINRMFARSKWGVFGNYYINKAILKDCDINRFDIHCYGRDITSIRCEYSQLYNQFSSVYGEVVFKKCEFDDFIPVLIESSYNAYTPFDLKWENCVFKLTKDHNYFITLFRVPEQYNERPELSRKCLPNFYVKNCKVFLDDNVKKWYLVQTHGVKYRDTFDYITRININGLRVENAGHDNFELFSEEIKTTNAVKIKVNK